MHAALDRVVAELLEVRAPVYDNFRLNDFRAWYVTNEPRISQYYRALYGPDAQGDPDYFEFAASQHDHECARVQERAA